MNHLLKIAIVFLAFTGLTARALEREEVAEAGKLFNQTFREGSVHQHVRDLSHAQRELLSAYLRSKIEDEKRHGIEDAEIAQSGNMHELALLDDDWAREQLVKAFWNNSRLNYHLLLSLREPKVIPIIGEGLFMEELPYRYRGEMLGPTQDYIAMIALDTLANSPDFSADVINWARGVERNWARRVVQPYNMKIMRDWYRANEDKLKAGDFKAVQPGAEPPERRDYPSDGHSRSSLPPGASAGTASSSSPGSTQTPASSRNAYAWIAALLLAVCGGLVWLLKRKRK